MGYFVLQNRKLQQRVVKSLTYSLSHQVGSEVSVDEIAWNFPNSFVLKNVCVEDQQRDTMLYMDRTKVTINLWQLFSSQISFRTIQLTGLKANLKVDSLNVPNYQFFVDAFKPDSRDTLSFQWKMDIESMAFDDCEITYYAPYREQKLIGKLNPNDLRISDINGCLFVRSFVEDSVHVLLDHIRFMEKSGLVIDNISSIISLNKEKIDVSRLDLKTPNGELLIAKALAYHDNYRALDDPINKLRWQISVSPSSLQPSDFSALYPPLDMLREPLLVEADAAGILSDFQVRGLSVRYGKSTKLAGDMQVRNLLPTVSDFVVDGATCEVSSSASELSDLLWVILDRNVNLPSVLDSLGTFSYTGSLNGDLKNLKTDGQILSNAGVIKLNASLNAPDTKLNAYTLQGKISSTECRLNRLLGDKSELGNSAFQLDVLLNKHSDLHYSMDAKGVIDSLYYKKYCYQDVRINGNFGDDGFDGKLLMSDKNADVNFEGKVDLRKEKPLFHFLATVHDFNLTNTHILTSDEETKLSFEVETNFIGNSIDDLEGSFSIDNILFEQEDREVVLNNFSLSATNEENGKRKLSVFSDYVNGNVTGVYAFSSLPAQFYNIAQCYLPALLKEKKTVKDIGKKSNFKFDFTIEDMEPIHEAYPLPLVVVEQARLTGFYDEEKQKFNVRLKSPQLKRGANYLADFVFLAENPHDELKLMCRATHLPNNSARNPYYLSVNTHTKDNTLWMDFNFSNSTADTYSGKLDLQAHFKDFVKGEGVTADIFFKPSEVILNDTIWKIQKSHIAIDKKVLEVDSFMFRHDTQYLSINGRNTSLESDSINVHFSDLHLGYISNIVANKNITFDGVTVGDLYLFQAFTMPHFKGDLYIYDGGLNGYVLGDMAVNTTWLDKEKCIDFDVKLLSPYNEQLSKSNIHGGVFLGNDSLYIGGDIKDVDLKFLRKYMGNVLQNNTGTVSGRVSAYGKFDHIGLEGTAYVKDMAFDVGYLKTSYVLSDSVYLTPNTIVLNQTQVYDTEGHYGVVSGMLLHDGFRNFKFAFDLDCNNLLALNTKEEDNETFYGRAYADGQAHISGVPEMVNINLDVRTMPNTLITIPIEGVSSAKEADFITFVSTDANQTMSEKRRIRREKIKQMKEKQVSPTEINLTVNVEATPDAKVHLIMDAQQGDIIRASGQGALSMNYNSKENTFKMFGGYEITKGDYLFTIQSVISRKFDIIEGSTVQWTGSPYNAGLNIKAKYALNASLSDIIEDPNLRSNTSLVNCMMDLTGTISSPNIAFDIELPNSDDDVRSKLKSVINTEELMNRNIASLLALGHFYSMDKSLSTVATTELSSVGFSTLSSQLTNWISKINQDVNIGLNYRPTSTGADGTIISSEFDVALSTQFLNDRLLLNGNFGYREELDGTNNNTTTGIVDFDLEYKINKSGKLRTKAFNRSNNSYFKTSPNTQGVGLVYREDFDTFSGLFKGYWENLKRLFHKRKERKENEEEELKKE